jgi:hypothetical protein
MSNDVFLTKHNYIHSEIHIQRLSDKKNCCSLQKIDDELKH